MIMMPASAIPKARTHARMSCDCEHSFRLRVFLMLPSHCMYAHTGSQHGADAAGYHDDEVARSSRPRPGTTWHCVVGMLLASHERLSVRALCVPSMLCYWGNLIESKLHCAWVHVCPLHV